jgi:hypothetical protein
MIPMLKNLWSRLLHDESAFRRWTRAALMGIAAGGIAFADQLDALLDGSGGLIKTIKVASVVAGFVSLMISVGEKNAQVSPAPEPPAQP